jgi:beta-glucoside operon transcriptional antiterminator
MEVTTGRGHFEETHPPQAGPTFPGPMASDVTASTQASVKRVYNNNVVLAIESDATEVVLLGKGIGFQRRPGDTVDTSLADQRFVAEGHYRATQLAGLLSDAPSDQITLAQALTELGHALELNN